MQQILSLEILRILDIMKSEWKIGQTQNLIVCFSLYFTYSFWLKFFQFFTQMEIKPLDQIYVCYNKILKIKSRPKRENALHMQLNSLTMVNLEEVPDECLTS